MTNPNQPNPSPDQQPHPDQTPTPEQLRGESQAEDIINSARALYESTTDNNERAALFAEGGFDGGSDLLKVADDIRKDGGRPLDSNETFFIDYMNAQTRNYLAASRLDMDAIGETITTSNGTEIEGDDAFDTQFSNTIGAIKDKLSRARSTVAKDKLEAQLKSVEDFKVIFANRNEIMPGMEVGNDDENDDSDGISIAHEYMEGVRALREATTDDERTTIQTAIDELAAKMTTRAEQFSLQASAYEAVSDHRTEFRVAIPTLADEDTPNHLHFVSQYPTTPAAGNGGTPPANANNGGNGTPANGGNNGNPPAGGNGQPPANGGNPNGGNNGPDGLGELDDDTLDGLLKDARKEVAKNKSRFVRNSKIGRAVLGFVSDLGFDSVRTGEDFDDQEDDYNQVVLEHAKRKNKDHLTNQSLSDQAKQFKFATTLHQEREEMNKSVNHEMQDRKALKVGRWMGKHKILTVGGMAILAPLTGGASMVAGMSLGLGMIAGAKMDDKFRGLRQTDESLTKTDLMNASMDVRSGIDAHLANPNLTDTQRQTLVINAIEAGFVSMQKLAITDLDKNMRREVWKRAGAVATMSGIAIAGTNIMPNPHLADQYIYTHQPLMRWTLLPAALIDLSIKRKDPNAGGHH